MCVRACRCVHLRACFVLQLVHPDDMSLAEMFEGMEARWRKVKPGYEARIGSVADVTVRENLTQRLRKVEEVRVCVRVNL